VAPGLALKRKQEQLRAAGAFIPKSSDMLQRVIVEQQAEIIKVLGQIVAIACDRMFDRLPKHVDCKTRCLSKAEVKRMMRRR
jgi:hypothetical protein